MFKTHFAMQMLKVAIKSKINQIIFINSFLNLNGKLPENDFLQ